MSLHIFSHGVNVQPVLGLPHILFRSLGNGQESTGSPQRTPTPAMDEELDLPNQEAICGDVFSEQLGRTQVDILSGPHAVEPSLLVRHIALARWYRNRQA
jgi:hypothetical protein